MVQQTRLGKLEFADIKASIVNYLKGQSDFTDYNFEGSGLSQLINILAYNAHYDALVANFLANEIFLDTATKRTSIVSRAKELGYTPRSRRASFTTLTLTLKNIANDSLINSVTLPRGSRFSTTVNDETFVYTTKEDVVLNKIIELGSPVFRNIVTVYEGVLVQHTAIFNTIDTITIPNFDIDTTTLKVEVYENATWVEYSQPQTFLTVNATSKVYMLQEGFNGFEIYFGDGILGYKPANTSNVRMTYIVTSGDAANGALNFTLTSAVTGTLTNTITTITASAQSTGGQLEESLESIKLNAKNIYGSQNRAVIASDYSALTLQNFSNIKDVVAWDGSENIPPKFGKVVMCVQPSIGDVISSTEKGLIADFLQLKSVGNVKVDFSDPEYLNLEVYSTVKYDANSINIGQYELEYAVKTAILTYVQTSAQKFKGSMRYSSLVRAIDNADYSIVGNETKVKLNKELRPNVFSANNFKFSFGNQVTPGTVKSDNFYDGLSSNKLYLKDANSSLHVYYSLNGVDVLYISNIGTINYFTGDVIITNLNINALDGLKFRLSTSLDSLDIYSSQNVILKLTQDDNHVTTVKDSNG